MATKNYKSDFNFILHLYSVLTDSAGKEKERTELPWPDYDWSAKFWTSSKANAYYASCIGGVCTNCRNTDGKIQIVVDNHNMGLGTLQVEFRAELPREIYPDGSERNVVPGVLDIELVRGAGDFPSDFEAQLQMPYIKLKYEDLTEEEKAEFQRPVTDATESLQKFQTTAEAAEVKREANEKQRVSAEQTRVAKETERQTKEATRQSQETQRVEAESDREEAETSRVSAEEKRAEEFATWETEIDGKADRSELSNVLAEKTDDGTTLKERGTGEVMYPQTLASLVKTSDGGNVDEGLEKAKFKVYVDMWNARCVASSSNGVNTIQRNTFGKYDPENAPDPQHTFYLNKLWLTYEESIEVMRIPDVKTGPENNNTLGNSRARTLFPIYIGFGANLQAICCQMPNLEVVRFVNYYIVNNGGDPDTNPMNVDNTRNIFCGCPKLREIQGVLRLNNNDVQGRHFYNAFIGAHKLETLWIQGICKDLVLKYGESIKRECWAYMIEHAANTSPITITVHPDVYAKLTGDTTNEAAAALTEEELAAWQQVVTDAAAKQISFATV